MVGADGFEAPTLCSQILSPDNNIIFINGLVPPRRLEMHPNVKGCTQMWGALLRALRVIVGRGRLPVRVKIVVGDEHLSRVQVHIDELNAEVLL